MALPISQMGYRAVIEPRDSKDGRKWLWEVYFFKQILASRLAETEEEAKQEAASVIGNQIIDKRAAAYPKQLAQLKLSGLLKRRPYMIAAVCECYLMMNLIKDQDVIKSAARNEGVWCDKDTSPHKKPVSTHPNALRPWEAAEKVVKLMREAGFVQVEEDGKLDLKGLRRYARKTFGSAMFTDMDETPQEQLTRELFDRAEALRTGKKYVPKVSKKVEVIEEDQVPEYVPEPKKPLIMPKKTGKPKIREVWKEK